MQRGRKKTNYRLIGNICKSHIQGKTSVLNMYRSLQPNTKRTIQLEKGTTDKRVSLKDIQMANKQMKKMFNIIIIQRKPQ